MENDGVPMISRSKVRSSNHGILFCKDLRKKIRFLVDLCLLKSFFLINSGGFKWEKSGE